jgi:glycosyltransferase involved in cell wall biosynthesis
MKRVLHVSKYYPPFVGGTEKTAKDCVQALAGNFTQKVLCFNHNAGYAIEIQDDVEIIRCACQTKILSQSLSIAYGKLLHDILKTFQPDYCFFHYPNPFAAHFLLKYLSDKCKLILYWHLDITRQKLLGKVFIAQNWKLLDRAEKVIATSPNYIVGSPYLSKYPEKSTVIPSCIDEEKLKMDSVTLEKAKNVRAKYPDKILCFAVGRQVEYKGFGYLVQASKLLDERYVIHIAGNGKLRKKWEAEANGDPKVIFLGQISDTDLKAHLYATDIFCFPSITKNEAFGIALAEAMYYGKPTVTFTINGSGVDYVSLSNVTGIAVENGNTEAYAYAIRKLSSDKSLIETYGKAAHLRVINNFLYKQYKTNIISTIGSI